MKSECIGGVLDVVFFFSFNVHAQRKRVGNVGGRGLGKFSGWTLKMLVDGFVKESQPAFEVLKHNGQGQMLLKGFSAKAPGMKNQI